MINMNVIHLTYPLGQIEGNEPIVLAIGYFDGLHLGHQQVIRTAQQMAKRLKCSLAVMTFDPHPKEVLQGQTDMRYLTPLAAKLNLFQQLGVEKTYVMKFDRGLASLSAEAFVDEIIRPLQIKGIVTGFNFRFGNRQAGDTIRLKQLGEGSFETITVPAVMQNGQSVSSTRIRQLLAEGKIGPVHQLLGRYHQFEGTVVTGDQRGRLIGYPTANIELSAPFCIPKRGVYVVRTQFRGLNGHKLTAYGMMNIGVRPTFKQNESSDKIEVHLFDQNIDLYGETLSVEVLHYLRAEQKFSSVDALVDQLGQDQQAAQTWLAKSELFT